LSHLTTIRTQITSIDALRLACAALGVPVTRGGCARFYAGLSEPCDYVITLPGRYDLGLTYQQASGTFAFVADVELLSGSFGSRDPGRQFLGEHAGRLTQEYAYAVLQLEARRKGLQIARQTQPNGTIRVVLQGRNL